MKQNKDIKLFGGGDFQKDYMFVDDICRAIKFLIKKSDKNQIYNIATGKSMSFKDILLTARNTICSSSDIYAAPFPRDQEYLQVKNMTLNVDKLKSMLFFPKMDFEEGLNEMCRIY
jgi:nucleoside-diphosphate-sugar epimerase